MCPHPFDPNCEEFSEARPIIVLKDKRGKSEYRGNNPKREKITCIRIDGCGIDDLSIKKCDYLLLRFMPHDDKKLIINEAHYIELKGTDVKQGIEQLISTVEITIDALIEKGLKRAYAKLVLRSTPKILPLKAWTNLRLLMKQYQGDAMRQNTPFEDTF